MRFCRCLDCGGCFFFSRRTRHTRWPRDWSSDVCSSVLFDAIEALRQFLVEVSSPVSERQPRPRGQACRRHADADGPPQGSEWIMNLIDNAVSRRRLLGYLGVGAGALGLAACGGSGGSGGGSGDILTGADLAAEVEASRPDSALEFLVEPDFPSVNGSTPGYTTMPDPLVKGIEDAPGAGGSRS